MHVSWMMCLGIYFWWEWKWWLMEIFVGNFSLKYTLQCIRIGMAFLEYYSFSFCLLHTSISGVLYDATCWLSSLCLSCEAVKAQYSVYFGWWWCCRRKRRHYLTDAMLDREMVKKFTYVPCKLRYWAIRDPRWFVSIHPPSLEMCVSATIIRPYWGEIVVRETYVLDNGRRLSPTIMRSCQEILER